MIYTVQDLHIKMSVLDARFVEENVEAFIAIAADIPHEEWRKSNYLFELPDKWKYSVVLTDIHSGQILGFIIASQKETAVHIHKFAIHPNYRSLKIGQQMLHFFEQKVKAAGMGKTISLYVSPDNPRAYKFYLAQGFTLIKTSGELYYCEKKVSVTIGVHQPNFFPWLGYFDKINKSDAFIFLDHVQFAKSEGTWANRVKLLINGEDKWLTAPIDRQYHGLKNVNEMQFDVKLDWRNKLLKTIQLNYSKTPFYEKNIEIVKNLVLNTENNISRYNSHCVKTLAAHLGFMDDMFYFSSDIQVDGNSNEMLINLTNKMNGTVYLCGDGATEYFDVNEFRKNGLDVKFQNFSPKPYPQYKQETFIPKLSFIDALFNIDFVGIRENIGIR